MVIKRPKIAYEIQGRSWISTFHLNSDSVLGNQGQAVCSILNRNVVLFREHHLTLLSSLWNENHEVWDTVDRYAEAETLIGVKTKVARSLQLPPLAIK